jgi:hypothetical protein
MTRTPDDPGTPVDPLAGLAPPGAPPELRGRVLAASRAAFRAGPARPDRWSLLWTSRPLRLAWAASFLLLLAGHAVLVRPNDPLAEAAPRPLSRSVSEADAELAAIGRLPPLDPDAQPLRAGSGEPSARSLPSLPEPPMENRT